MGGAGPCHGRAVLRYARGRALRITAPDASDPPSHLRIGGTEMKPNRRRELLKTAAMLVAGSAAAQSGAAAAEAPGAHALRRARRRSFPSQELRSSFPCGGSIASDATTPRTRARWAPIPAREPPFFFQKPTDAIQIVPPGMTIDHPYPTLTKNYHYEVELVAALGKGGRDMPPERALDLRDGVHGRPRHDAARSPARDGRREEAVGDRQELRPFGGAGVAPAGVEDGALHARRDLAQGQRRRPSRTRTSAR